MKRSDILPGFFREDISLKSDPYGKNPVATLVSKPCETESQSAVLYIHGYGDYFFNEEFGDRFIRHGFNFYALDLRRYGRSIRDGDIPFMVDKIEDYFEEIHNAIKKIKFRDGNTKLILYGHSTGGLIIPLYAHIEREKPLYDAIILNSPFWDFRIGFLKRWILLPIIVVIGRYFPLAEYPVSHEAELYGQSLHKDFKGEWRFNCRWKPVMDQVPYYMGWIRAVFLAHCKLKHGLDIQKPVLVMISGRSGGGRTWNSDYTSSDCVLDVAHMERYAPAIGKRVKLLKFENTVHDLLLSRKDVRDRVYNAMFKWIKETLI